jgi:chitodextrinase
LAALAASLVLGAVRDAEAVITEPLPADAPLAPPPIPTLPAAGDTPPPADVIADPVEPGAVCGGWYQQSSYAGAWSTSSTWWEYQCRHEYPQCVGMCNADWGPYVWIDYFYWDGSNPVFYGEFFGDFYFNSMWSASGCSYWWDAPTSQWYLIQCPPEEPGNQQPTASVASSCSDLSCGLDGSGSSDSDGTIVAYEWVFGDGTAASGVAVQHAYAQPGTYVVTLTVTDDAGASDSDSTTVAVTAPNLAPTAAFTHSCSGLSCAFNGSGSTDSDGAIVGYEWVFGDGTTASGVAVQHTYAQPGSYTVTLTVTDDDGSLDIESKAVALITLTARGYTAKGLKEVDLAWTGSNAAGFHVYRNGTRIATAQATAYTDTIYKKDAGSYVYKVCAVATPVCSNKATVTL